MIVPRNKVCDDVFDCSDLSDECLCEGKVPDICKSVVQVKRKMLDKKRSENASCKIGQVQCSDGNCINRTSVCDSKGDCSDNLDEKFSYCRGTLLCKEALLVDSGTECRCYESCDLSVGIVCDNKGQCQPPVVGVEGKAGKWGVEPGFPIDECFNQCINITTFGCTVPFAKAYGTPVQAFSCETYGSKRNKSDKYFTSYDSQQTCDGIVDCLVNGEDETYCPNRFSCLAGRLISIKLSKVCDGIVDCDDGKDESNTTCPDRFFCSSLGGALVSIPLNQTCDLYNNCDNSADEMNCTDGRFYCENKTPLFVRKEQTFDGHFDCSDYSDECPTQTEYRNEDIFSSRYQLIANPILRALVWIMGLGALIGNAIVIYGESKHLRQILEKGGRAPLRTNHILILNLAIADFLMGVYLIILGIAGAIFSGNFCLHRLNWLSSTTCTAMGVLVVLSSECSVFTMILLTSFRIFAVVKPFSASNSPKAITVLCVIAIAWIFSFLIALLPLSTQLEDIFVDKALLSDNLFFKNVVVKFDSAKTYLTKLISFDPSYSDIVNESFSQIKDAGTWLDLQRIVYGTNQTRYLEFTRYFGYYSADAVCIPRFFVMKNEKTWKYSLSLAIINFLSFVYVASGYCFIIWFRLRTTKKNKETLHVQNADKQNAEMQKKIVRLVVTDFCCWVPISIMAFINFSGFKVQEIAYAISAIVLLPINSALNPLLYSDILDKLFSKIKSKFFEKSETSSVPNSSSDRTQPTLSSRSKR